MQQVDGADFVLGIGPSVLYSGANFCIIGLLRSYIAECIKFFLGFRIGSSLRRNRTARGIFPEFISLLSQSFDDTFSALRQIMFFLGIAGLVIQLLARGLNKKVFSGAESVQRTEPECLSRVQSLGEGRMIGIGRLQISRLLFQNGGKRLALHLMGNWNL